MCAKALRQNGTSCIKKQIQGETDKRKVGERGQAARSFKDSVLILWLTELT